MIKIGREFRPYRSKVWHNADTSTTDFSVQDSRKEGDSWVNGEWYTVRIDGDFPCEKGDGTTVELTKINGVQAKPYNGKTYVTIYAEAVVRKNGKALTSVDTQANKAFAEATGFDDTSDLPF